MLRVISFLVYVCWATARFGPINSAGCVISTRYEDGDLKEPQPLLLERNNKNAIVLYPDKDGMLRVPTGGSIYLACPGENNYLKQRDWGNETKAVCVRDKLFNLNGELHDFSTLTCFDYPEHVARYANANPCLENRNLRAPIRIEIGFNVNKNTFIRTIELCRDNKNYGTYYTKFKMTKMIMNFHMSDESLSFQKDVFYSNMGMEIDDLYKSGHQRLMIRNILNSDKLAKKRLKKSILSRGHLTARRDFVYDSLQRSTFWFLNVAPQWKTFNAGNWKSLEISVRNFASNRRLDLDVYTGVYGQMTMKDENGKQQRIYLNKRFLPVPRFFWKVIYDPLSKRGTAFIGLNDPFIESITEDVYLCKNISHKIKWLKWESDDIQAGVSYACTVSDLQKAVPTVPMIESCLCIF